MMNLKSNLIKKILIVLLFGNFFIIALSQNVDHTAGDHYVGGHFVKRVEYNLIIDGNDNYHNLYNLKSKREEEILFFGNFNAPVEFFYSPSFDGTSSFRIMRDSLGATILEIKYFSNYKEAQKGVSDKYPLIGFSPYSLTSLDKDYKDSISEYNRNIANKRVEEIHKLYKVETLTLSISTQFSEKLYEKIILFIGNFKAKGVPQIIEDGYSVTFRTVVDDEVWTLEIHMPEGDALKMADLCLQIIKDAKKDELDEEKYISVLDMY